MENSKVNRFDVARVFRGCLLMIVFAILVLLPSTADACPNCKDSLYENYVSMAFGFSVIFMMAMPFSILGAWVFYVARIARIDRAKALVSS